MKYGFTFLSLVAVLFLFTYTSPAFSQNIPTQPDTTEIQPLTPQDIINELIDPNTGLPSGIEEQITITQIPRIPQPGQQVSVQITGYTTDLDKAVITWSINGTEAFSQRGATRFNLTAPTSGATLTLEIQIQKENGGVISKTIVLNPADVDLIYEAKTYTHPFYQGKKEYTSEAFINFIAIPNFVNSNGVKIPASELVYTWKVNNTVQQGASGYGRNMFITKGSLIERQARITVDVSAVGSDLKATQTISSVRSTQPEVVLYENNPLLGIVYEKAIAGVFTLDRPQVDFEAVPYFFSTNFKNSSEIEYDWSINGVQITNKAPNENYLVLRNEKNENGRASIAVSVDHIAHILQTTRNSIQLDFNKVENLSNEEFIF